MSSDARTTCAHGVPTSHGLCYQCGEELRLAQFKAAFPGEDQSKERRAKWIRENAIHLYEDDLTAGDAIRLAAMMADELIKRGYL